MDDTRESTLWWKVTILGKSVDTVRYMFDGVGVRYFAYGIQTIKKLVPLPVETDLQLLLLEWPSFNDSKQSARQGLWKLHGALFCVCPSFCGERVHVSACVRQPATSLQSINGHIMLKTCLPFGDNGHIVIVCTSYCTVCVLCIHRETSSFDVAKSLEYVVSSLVK